MMTTSYISSLSLWNAPRSNLSSLQNQLATANREIVDGRYADVGLELGASVGLSLGLRQKTAEIDALKDGNGIAALRLGASQAALKQIQTTADATLKNLIGLPAGQRAASVLESAGSGLAALTSLLNTSVAGQYVFGGTNTRQSPVAAYGDAASGAKAAVATAFRGYFGFAQGDAAAAGVTANQLRSFIDGPLATLFSAGGWSGDWSNASDRTIDSRISLGETVATSASANAAPIRRLAMAYVIASDLGLTAFSSDAQEAATERVASLLGEASAGLVGIQADLGRAQSRITDANTRLDTQKTLLTRQFQDMEAVDPAEAKSRVDALTTQIQMSYALTSQLRQLSLVAYL